MTYLKYNVQPSNNYIDKYLIIDVYLVIIANNYKIKQLFTKHFLQNNIIEIGKRQQLSVASHYQDTRTTLNLLA